MCGILGVFGFESTVQPEAFANLLKIIRHRGPDTQKMFASRLGCLGATRLSIVDQRSVADQPFISTDRTLAIVFNGEIYNHRTLKTELCHLGHSFRTDCDTEVVLEGFRRWKENLFSRLRGMFSLAVLGLDKGELTLARDSFGIKPLFYRQSKKYFAFASEPKALVRISGTKVSDDTVNELIFFRHKSFGSNFDSIIEVRPGEVLTIDLHAKKARSYVFFDPVKTFLDIPLDTTDTVQDIEKALIESLDVHTKTDIPLCYQLSGGVDSSLLVALASTDLDRSLETFSIVVKDPIYSEQLYQNEVAVRFSTKHHFAEVGQKEFLEALPRTIEALDGPTPHFGCAVLDHLYSILSRQFRIVVVGEGADELFCGYNRYIRTPKILHATTKQYFSEVVPEVLESVYFDLDELSRLFPTLKPNAGNRNNIAELFPDRLRRLVALDRSYYLQSLLERQDRLSMSHSVEARVPFVDLNLWRVVAEIPLIKHVEAGVAKAHLKRFATKYFTAEFVFRPKNGLLIPIEIWMEPLKDILLESNSSITHYTDRKFLSALMRCEAKRVPGTMSIIPHLINVELWLRYASCVTRETPFEEQLFI